MPSIRFPTRQPTRIATSAAGSDRAGTRIARTIAGGLPEAPQHTQGMMNLGSAGGGLLMGAVALFLIRQQVRRCGSDSKLVPVEVD